MNYVKKMCILRQLRQGFSGDGKALSGLIKVEQYGKNLAVEVSIINFAPLVSGEYYCLLSDGRGKTEMLALRGKSIFNILSDIDISRGFCGIICYVKNDVIPVAYGINGNGSYDWRTILNATLPPIFPQNTPPSQSVESAESEGSFSLAEETEKSYDDESVATENYYREEEKNGQIVPDEAGGDARLESPAENEKAQAGADLAQNDDADDVRHPFKTEGDGYYLAVRNEIDELMKSYPLDDTLKGAFSCSEWVRVKGEADSPQYLVGIVYDDGKAAYICYALAAEDKDNPPEEIKSVCTFVPTSPYDEQQGFFVIYQSAATGECIKPTSL